jgi:hypothetical protein
VSPTSAAASEWFTALLADLVGPDGQVVGIDASAAQLAQTAT